jgi:hypothetical protein
MQTDGHDEIWRSAAGSYLACTNQTVRYFGCPRYLTPPPQDAYDERSWVVIPTSRGNFGLLVEWMTIQQVLHNADRTNVLMSLSAYPLIILAIVTVGAMSSSFGASGAIAAIILLIAGALGFFHIVRKIVWRPIDKEMNLGRGGLIQIPDIFFDIVEHKETARAAANMKLAFFSKAAGAAGGVVAGGLVSGLLSKSAETLIVKGVEFGVERAVEKAGGGHASHDAASQE